MMYLYAEIVADTCMKIVLYENSAPSNKEAALFYMNRLIRK